MFLLQWLEEAQLDRVGAFAYENVAGAASRDLPGHVPEEVKQQRRERFTARPPAASAAPNSRPRSARPWQVLVDQVRPDGVAVARSLRRRARDRWQCLRHPRRPAEGRRQAQGRIDRSDAFDLHASPTDFKLRATPMTQPLPGRRMHRVISRV